MAQVPYQPYSEVQAQDIPTPNVHVQVNEAAFGGGTAAAIKQLGAQLKHSGEEIFSEALKIKDLENQTAARQADMARMEKTSKAHMEFDALPPAQKGAALQGHIEKLKSITDEYRSTLTNPMAQKYYDAYGHADLRHQIFNASGVAGTATRKAHVDAGNSQISLLLDGIDSDPSNANFEKSIEKIKKTIQDIKTDEGLTEPQVQDKTEKMVSQAVAAKIKGILRSDPIGAANALDQYQHLLKDQDYNRLVDVVQNRAITVQGDRDAREVNRDLDDPDKPEKSREQVDKEMTQKARERFPNDPQAEIKYRKLGQDERMRIKAQNKERANDDLRFMQEDILARRPKNVEELLNGGNQKVRETWDHMTETQKKNLEDFMYQRYREDRDRPSAKRDAMFMYLWGARKQELVDTDLTAIKDLTWTQRVKLMTKQRMDAKNIDKEEDPRVRRAMEQLNSQLVGASTPNLSKDQLQAFKGEMQYMIEEHIKESGGKPPTREEIARFGKSLILKTVDESRWPGFKGQYVFEKGLAAEERDIIEKSIEQGFLPSDMTDVDKERYSRRVRARSEYRKLYGRDIENPRKAPE